MTVQDPDDETLGSGQFRESRVRNLSALAFLERAVALVLECRGDERSREWLRSAWEQFTMQTPDGERTQITLSDDSGRDAPGTSGG